MSRLRLVVALSALLALAAAPTAHAHQGNPNYRSVIDQVGAQAAWRAPAGAQPRRPPRAAEHERQDRGRQGLPGRAVRTDSRRRHGRRSTTTRRRFYLNNDRTSTAGSPGRRRAGATPDWQIVDRAGRFQWHDHRIHWMSTIAPKQVTDKTKRTKVFDWKVPLQVGATNGAVDGTLFWAGTGGGAAGRGVAGLALIALLGLGAVVVVRRRRGAEAPVGAGGERGVVRAAPPRAARLLAIAAPAASAHATLEGTTPGARRGR